MVRDDREDEQTSIDMGIIAKRVREDDSTSSPKNRATKVYDVLLNSDVDLSNLDLICFSAEYLGSQVPTAPWLERVAKEVAWAVYATYYVLKDEEFKWLDQKIKPPQREEKS